MLTSDTYEQAHARICGDDEAHCDPACSGRPGADGSRDRIGEQSAEPCLAALGGGAERGVGTMAIQRQTGVHKPMFRR